MGFPPVVIWTERAMTANIERSVLFGFAVFPTPAQFQARGSTSNYDKSEVELWFRRADLAGDRLE
jgi:hypothetical protein